MKNKVLAHLHHVQQAAHAIKKFIAEHSFDDYV